MPAEVSHFSHYSSPANENSSSEICAREVDASSSESISAACFNSWPVSSKAATVGNGVSLCCLFSLSQCNSDRRAGDAGQLNKNNYLRQPGRVGETIEKNAAD